MISYLETGKTKYDISIASGGFTLDYLFRGSSNVSSAVRSGLYLSSRFFRLCDRYNRTPREYFNITETSLLQNIFNSVGVELVVP